MSMSFSKTYPVSKPVNYSIEVGKKGDLELYLNGYLVEVIDHETGAIYLASNRCNDGTPNNKEEYKPDFMLRGRVCESAL